jgi:predicted TIM-barrel fold metal-dependent hydrolase
MYGGSVSIEIVDGQIHIPRIVVDWRRGHPRATDADVPIWDPPRQPVYEAADWDAILTGTLTAMDAAGVSALVVDEWLGHDAQGRMTPGHEVEGGFRYTFDFSAYAAARYPERFSFLARVHWTDPYLDDVVAHHAATPGMRCLRVDPMPWLPDIEAFRAGRYAPIFAAAERHDLPVFVWSNGPNLSSVVQYLERFPGVRIIIDHLGTVNPSPDATGFERYGPLEAVFELGRRYENFAVKWCNVVGQSAEPYPYRDMLPYLLRALDAFGPERIYWASDWSQHRVQQSWAESFWWLLASDEVSRTDKESILGRSLRTLLRWPAAARYFDCAQAHPSMRISGSDDDEFVANMRAHLERWHPQPALHAPRELLLARAKQGSI